MHAISFCLSTFLKYIRYTEKLKSTEGFVAASKFICKMINFNGEPLIQGVLSVLAHSKYQQIGAPAFKLVKLLVKQAESPSPVTFVSGVLTAPEVHVPPPLGQRVKSNSKFFKDQKKTMMQQKMDQ